MQKTKIEWVRNPDGSQGYSWNPIKGICPVRCKLPDGRIYCYGKKIYHRFVLSGYLKIDPNETWQSIGTTKRKGIFVCSIMELFHPKILKEWRDSIFEVIKNYPQHRFYILTKFPQNIDRPMPDNAWLGVSITGHRGEDFIRAAEFGFKKRRANIQFISYEPLLEEPIQKIPNVDWIIIGRLTQHGHKYDPQKEWIAQIVEKAKSDGIPIFLKDNLSSIWGEDLIQEFPK